MAQAPTDERRVAELERLLKDGVPFAEAVNKLAPTPAAQTELMRRAAVTRTFDRAMFDAVIATSGRPTFEEFVRTFGVGRTRPGSESYRVADSVAADHLESWLRTPDGRRDLVRFTGEIYAYLREQKQGVSPVELLRFQIPTDPEGGQERFEMMFAEADERFDLATCHALVQMLRELDDFTAGMRSVSLKLLSQNLRLRCADLIPYVAARGRFIEEWVKSERYLDRVELSSHATTFLDAPGNGMLPIFGAGGRGKTMFLRWLVARHCVPIEQRIPVGKVDFDDINVAKLERYPWLVLVRLAEQINRQIAGAPFNEMLGRNADFASVLLPTARIPEGIHVDGLESSLENVAEAVAQEVISDFASAVSGQRVVLILDTLEEAVLHFPGSIRSVLTTLRTVQARVNPSARVKLILSGRYDLKREKTKKFLEADDPDPIEIGKFSSDDAGRYLSTTRGVERKLVKAIVGKADGNPFILSLIADLVEQKALREESDIEALKPEFAYLILRVIDRIPDTQRAVRWVVRYGVVPRVLSPDFLHHVMEPHLRRELEGIETDRRDKVTEYGDSFPRGGTVDLAALWKDLASYADSTGWLRGDDHSLRFQPEVVEPMRALLAQESIYADLHRAAARWFEQRASDNGSDPARWASYLAEAFFHRFSLKTAGLEQWWLDRLRDPRAQGAVARQPMLEVVTSLVPPNAVPLDDVAQPLFTNDVLVQIDLEVAKLRAGIGWDVAAKVGEPTTIRELLASARTRLQGAERFPEAFALVEAALAVNDREYDRALACLEGIRGARESESETRAVPGPADATPSHVRPSRQITGAVVTEIRATTVLTTDADRFAYELLRARALAGKKDASAEQHYYRAWAYTVRRNAPAPAILAECAREFARMGNLVRALKVYTDALAAADGGPEMAVLELESAELLLEVNDVARASELAASASAVFARTAETDSPYRFRAFRVHALCAIATGRLPLAEALVGDLQSTDASALQIVQLDELRGILAAAIYDVDRAASLLQAAASGYASAGDHASASRSLLRAVWVLKELKGDWRSARLLLQRSTELTSELLAIERAHLDHLLGEPVRQSAAELQTWPGAAIALLTATDRGNDEVTFDVILRHLATVEPATFRHEQLHFTRWLPALSISPRLRLDRQVDNLFTPPEPGLYDFFPRVLDAIEIRRCARNEAAVDLLHRCYAQATGDVVPHDRLIDLADRLGAEAPDVDAVLKACALVQGRGFGAACRIRLASLFQTRGDARAAALSDQVDFPDCLRGTQYEAFHLMNRARLLLSAKRDDEARRLAADAAVLLRSFGRELGNLSLTPPPNPTGRIRKPPNDAPAPGVPNAPWTAPGEVAASAPKTAPSPAPKPAASPAPSEESPELHRRLARVSLKAAFSPFGAATRGQVVSSEEARAVLAESPRVIEFMRDCIPPAATSRQCIELMVDDASTVTLPWEWAEREGQLFYRSAVNLPEAVGNRALKIVWTRLPVRLRRSLQSISPLRVTVIRPYGSHQQAAQRGFEVASGQSLPEIYRHHGAKVFEPTSMSVDGINRALREHNPQVIHIQASVLERRGAIGVDLPLDRQTTGSPQLLTADFWTQQFRTIASVHEPVIILDPPRPPSDIEVARQLLLRNRFGADLAATGTVRGVLGIGLFPPASSELAAERLAFEIVGNPKFEQLLMLFRKNVAGDRFCTQGASLFVSDLEALVR